MRVRRHHDTAAEGLGPVLRESELPHWLRERMVIEQARLALAQGRTSQGVALLDGEAVDGDRRSRVRALAGLLGAEGAVSLLSAQEPGSAPADVLEHLVLRACQLAEAGTLLAAVGELMRALDVARPELHRLPFLDAPPQARRLLRTHPRLQDRSGWLNPSSPAVPRRRAPAAVSAPAAAHDLTQDLSERETEVLHHLAEMLSTAEIAATMFISVNTVRTHIRSILRKLGVSRRNQAVRRAREHGLL
jgi:LuxR family maltose regulon positive regulatory protein